MFDTVTNGPDEGPPKLVRWVLDPERGTVREELLDDRVQEFPRIDGASTTLGVVGRSCACDA